ncbi:MAG: efflux RND transporter permease subunit [Lachnospiraceae bacterium]|jgi:HAE1 family hydrophobic/amphiphilic exporter-1|nr:efflux RND transporter permease subunit [Lachnospiraceae bacterium]
MLSKLSVRKPYTVVVGIVLVLILGVVSFMNMSVDLLPNMNLPYAIVITTYPGASPESVEQTISRPIEQSMATVSNIKELQSISNENTSVVILEFAQTANMDSVTIEMRDKLDQIKGYWPDEVGNPIIMRINPDMLPVLVVAVSMEGEDQIEAGRKIVDEVVPEIESLEGVAEVDTFGEVSEYVEVIVDHNKLKSENERLTSQLTEKVDEAKEALADAKAQVKKGQAALASGKKKATEGLQKAEEEYAVKSEELKQAQLEIASKEAELNVASTQLAQLSASLQSVKAPLVEQKTQLQTLKSKETEMQSAFDALQNKVTSGVALTDEETRQMAELSGNLLLLQNYDSAMSALDDALKPILEQEATLNDSKKQLDEGKNQLEALKSQVNSGAMTLAQARGALTSAQINAVTSLSEGMSKLAAGEAMLTAQEAQVDAMEEQASAAVNLDSILNASLVKTILAAENFSMPAGNVTENGISYQIRVGDKFKTINDIKNLKLLSIEGADPVYLENVATVKFVNNADKTYAKLNGESGILLQIQKQTGYSTGDVSDRILNRLSELEDEVPGMKAVALMDQGVYIDMVTNSVLENLLFGGILAILILLVFLRSIRPTLVIAFSIPISVVAAVVAMYFSGVTLNVLSLSGLALGVGMLVDNSIVVIENIFRMRNEEGKSAGTAAIEGAKQIAGAIIASTLTTVCVFLPIVFTQGITRQLFVDFGLTITYSLMASLLVALTVVPMMSAGLLKNSKQREFKFFVRFRDWYGRLLSRVLNMKALVLIITLVLFVGSIYIEFRNGTEFLPSMENTQITISLEMEEGSDFEELTKEADKISERVLTLDDIEDVGGLLSSGNLLGIGGSSGQTVQFYAIAKENAKLSNRELVKEIEELTKDIKGTVTVEMAAMDMSALGSTGIVVQIRGKDLDKLREITKDVREIVEKVDGVENVYDGLDDVKEELKITVDKDKAMDHGLTVAQVFNEVYQRVGSTQSATTLTTQSQDYSVYVKEDTKAELTRADIKALTFNVTKQDGSTEEVKLSDVADFENTVGFRAINRQDQSRYTQISADVAEDDNIGLVSAKVSEALESYDVPAGYDIEMVGEDSTIAEAMDDLYLMLVLALAFMYLIMVAQFQSLLSPFIVMFTVPLAFTGGMLALTLTAKPLSVVAMIGFIMLAGIIVNNGIVFVDYTNILIAEGMEQKQALIEAGKTRLRPILMTAVTTILGLSTMAAGFGMGADMVQPMAIVTIGGLLYGTLLTLLVVPCIYMIFHPQKKVKTATGDEKSDFDNYDDNQNHDSESDSVESSQNDPKSDTNDNQNHDSESDSVESSQNDPKSDNKKQNRKKKGLPVAENEVE